MVTVAFWTFARNVVKSKPAIATFTAHNINFLLVWWRRRALLFLSLLNGGCLLALQCCCLGTKLWHILLKNLAKPFTLVQCECRMLEYYGLIYLPQFCTRNIIFWALQQCILHARKLSFVEEMFVSQRRKYLERTKINFAFKISFWMCADLLFHLLAHLMPALSALMLTARLLNTVL